MVKIIEANIDIEEQLPDYTEPKRIKARKNKRK